MAGKVNLNNYVELICSICGTKFSILKSEAYYRNERRKTDAWFCNKKCYGKWLGLHTGKKKHQAPILNNHNHIIFLGIPSTIGSHAKSQQWIKLHSKEVSDYVLQHSKKEAQTAFAITSSSVLSSLYQQRLLYLVPESYLVRRKSK